MECDTMPNIYINILGKNIKDTGACAQGLFPEESDTGQVYHRFILNTGTKHAVENEDTPRMENLKEHRLSESSSSMDTDSLPDYDSLCNDGGDAGNHDGGYRMTNLKSASEANTSGNWPVSLPSTSASSSDSNAEPGTSSSTKTSGQIPCHVYQVCWDKDKGQLWATLPIWSSVFIVVLDVDLLNKYPGVSADYIDMVKSVGDLCRHKGVHESEEFPTIYLIGHTKRTGNDAKNTARSLMKKFRNEMSQKSLPMDCIVADSSELLVNSDQSLTDTMQLRTLRRALTNPSICNRSPSDNIHLAKQVYNAIGACKSFTIDIPSLQKTLIDQVDKSSLVKTLQYLHTSGLIVYIGCSFPIWIRPGILTRACAILCQMSSDDLTREKITSRLKVQLKSTRSDAEMCLKALERIGIMAQITEGSVNGENSYTNSYGDREHCVEPPYISSLKLETKKDDPFNKLPANLNQTPVLRFTLRERKPEYVFCNMYVILVQKGWKPLVKGGNTQIFRNCATFQIPSTDGGTRLFLSINNGKVHVVIADFSDEEINIDKSVNVRQDVENAMLSVAYNETDARDLGRYITREIRCKNSKGALNGTDGWNSVDSLRCMLTHISGSGKCDQHEDSFVPHSIEPSEILHMWFPTHAQSIKGSSMELTDDEMSVSYGSPDLKRKKDSQGPQFEPVLTDGFLSKISKCFGSGWEQFFVENDLEQRQVDTAKANNPLDMTKQVYCCLQFWKHRQKEKATFKRLKGKVKECDHLTFSFEELGKILVAEARKQTEGD